MFNFAKNARPVMFVTKNDVCIYTDHGGCTYIERKWFDKALTGSDNIINYYYKLLL